MTRDTYAGVYRAFSVFVAPAVGALTPEAVRGHRDALERTGRAPGTIATRLGALRTVARALDVDGVDRVGDARAPRAEPRALTSQEYMRQEASG